MTYTFHQKPDPGDLNHYGVQGMKWGVRIDRRASFQEMELRGD